nr:MAG TPA: hypothetical protein [Caudoviricetes sp.]
MNKEYPYSLVVPITGTTKDICRLREKSCLQSYSIRLWISHACF